MFGRRNKFKPLAVQCVIGGVRFFTPFLKFAVVFLHFSLKFSNSMIKFRPKQVSREDGPYLGYTDLIGQSYTENFICTGYGGHLALPIIRDEWKPDMYY